MRVAAKNAVLILSPMIVLEHRSAIGRLSTRKNCIIRDHLLHEILAVPANKRSSYQRLERIGAFSMRTQKQQRKNCVGYTSRATNPDIQLLIDPLLCETLDPAIADAKEERIVDPAWETRGKKE